MSRLITNTTDEQVSVLLVGTTTQLSQLMAKHLLEHNLDVTQLSFLELQQQPSLLRQEWYKIIFLFQHTQASTDSFIENGKQLSMISELVHDKTKLQIIFPLTTNVAPLSTTLPQPQTNQLIEITNKIKSWKQQVLAEKTTIETLHKSIDISTFIYYKNYASGTQFPISFFLSQLNQGQLVDPELEVSLQSGFSIIKALDQELFMHRASPVIILGKTRQSKVYTEKIKVLCRQYFDISLPIFTYPLQEIPHPSNAWFQLGQLHQTEQSVTELSIPLVRELSASQIHVEQYQQIAQESALTAPDKKHFFNAQKSPNNTSKDTLKDIPKKPNSPQVLEHNTSEDKQLSGGKPSDNKLTGIFEMPEVQVPPYQPVRVIPGDQADEVGDGEGVDDNDIQEEHQENPEEDTDVGNLIYTMFSQERTNQKQSHLTNLTKKTALGKKKLFHSRVLFIGGMSVAAIAAGLLTLTGIFLVKTAQAKQNMMSYISSISLPETAQDKRIKSLQTNASWIKNELELINNSLSLPVFPQALQVAQISNYISELYRQRQELSAITNQTYHQIVGADDKQQATDTFAALTEIDNQITDIFTYLSLLQTELDVFPTEELSVEEEKQLKIYRSYLEDQRGTLAIYQQLYPLLPSLLGQERARTYALVMQNNQELRPTGGFIQAVALITVDKGKITQLSVDDVYHMDQQLTGAIAPPAEITRLLGEERWYLRDSNWNPDFPTSAKQITWFIEQSQGVKIDGVIGVDLPVMKNVLEAVGQLNLPEYNEVITAQNLDERLEYHSEVQLVESSETPDYSELLFRTLIEKLQNLSDDQVSPLLHSLVASADDKELLIALQNSEEQSSMEMLGWSGSMVEPSCPTVFGDAECVVDAIAQVEANVGVNKANYYVDRQIDHSIQILPNKVQHKRVVVYKNKAGSNAWPKGTYKAFTRFYLPETAQFGSVVVDGTKINDENLFLSQENNRQVVGVVTETVISQETHLELVYTLPHQSQTPFSYVFFDQKQPGARKTSPRVFLNFAAEYEPTLIAPQAEVQGDLIIFNPSNDQGHTFVGATFE